ncbi:MAG: cardiolipin synthase [Eubacteriales bacterium]|nr:cardiolipin synthase [Eubacteriales bacterium]MDY3332175.1 cardiolipin synthase [Gallibacter sp.]
MIYFIFIINIFIALGIIFMERKDPSVTLAWIMVLFLLPGAGAILYALFSQNIARQKIFKMTEKEYEENTHALQSQNEDMESGSYQFHNEEAYKWKRLIRLNNVCGKAYYTETNEVDLFFDGAEKIAALINDIRDAKESVFIEYFIIKRDMVGDALLKALIRKAKEGVEVRLLVDAFGSRRINKKLVEKLKRAGGHYAEFFPTKWKIFTMKINYRNHRKLAVIDNRIGYIGGFNIAREYVGLKKRFGYWRDTHARIRGGSVTDLALRFLMDWRSASNDPVDLSQAYYNEPERPSNVGIQIVSNGLNQSVEEIKFAFMKMINAAEERIYIQTPYFVPDIAILEALKVAAQSGIDVKIMIPSIPDHAFVYWATYSYVAEMMEAGGEIYIYNNGFLHAKTMTIDGEISTVGSTNFDRRSFSLNFESNAIFYDRVVTAKLDAAFDEDLKGSTMLTKELYDKRSRIIKIKEPISRLLSDIL